MKRKQQLITWLVAAATTFGILFAVAGPKHFPNHHWHHHSECTPDSSVKKGN